MAIDVEVLILEPFREVVERGKEAAANAEAAQDDDPELSKEMAKAAQAVMKGGERALKRLQPLWDSQVEKYGDDFKETMRENDEIADKRRILGDLLYDFDDFIDIDSFDGDKFAELQAATKAFALHALDTIRRLKIDVSAPATPIHAFPPLPPLPPLRTQSHGSSRPGTRGADSPAESVVTVIPPPALPHLPAGTQAARHESFTSNGSRRSSGGRQIRPQVLQRTATTSSRGSSVYTTDGGPPRRADSWTAPATKPGPPQPQRLHERRPSSPDILGDELERVRIVTSPSTSSSPRTSAWISDQTGGAPRAAWPLQASIPENAAVATRVIVGSPVQIGRRGEQHPHHHYHGYTPASSVFDPTSPATTNRTSLFSDTNTSSSPSTGPSPNIPSRDAEVRAAASSSFSFLHLDASHMAPIALPPVGEHEDGLMLAAEERTLSDAGGGARSSSALDREAACAIGPKSSFHQLKGFCDGAVGFRLNGHAQGVKKASAYGEPVTVGRCSDCEYYHIFSEIAMDLDKDSRANFMKSGVMYRTRFLFKSHLTITDLASMRYACLFCTHAGQTVREGDATVFFSQDQLLRHLSRHPQPLAPVPGVTVLYGRVGEDDADLAEDYDLHFPDPPAPSPVPSMALACFPSATALKSHVRRFGEKPLVDPDGNGDVLKFLVGARIVGVEFPERWGGKWCVGWHDGVRGAFPAKLVEIEGPRQSEISLQSNSGVSVVTRWKWDPKDNGRTGWMVFDKGDTIRNIGWLYQDHWCWSGTNSKGKYGVFPRSHVNPDSIKEGGDPGGKKTQTSLPMKLFGRGRAGNGTDSSSINGEVLG
ncbi:hypothetical protein QBC33DRAFT_497839 [Phialemonium atrogriseum]|uniref:SH3 domain-containing protein n=1 Tax=Phialemonium atrogriseum TaxID=1093897 RepID=A0AAJ0BTK7_9PEZI|nr:uncharacterized protein QBC33DRAFT_497839 [Phialemonium atrogriseum]KAK1764258.1 hypothetical protein QBC33DRAFT_497839 [Phialemonium atrogriseum]